MFFKLSIVLLLVCSSPFLSDSQSTIARILRNRPTATPRINTTTVVPQDVDTSSQDFAANVAIDMSIESAMRLSLFGGHLTRDEALACLKRAADYILHNKQPPRSRGNSFDTEAKKLLRFMTADEVAGSTSEESELPSHNTSLQDSPVKVLTTDPEPSTSRERSNNQRFSLETKRRIVKLADAGTSEKSIKSQYKHYRRQYLTAFRRDVAASGSATDKRAQVDEYVSKRVDEAIANGRILTEDDILGWAGRMAREIGFEDNLGFGKSWLYRFKERRRVVSRKITKTTHSSERLALESIDRKTEQFYSTYSNVCGSNGYVRPSLIWNVDQTGFNYEQSRKRTLARKGQRDVVIKGGSKNKRFHSYTSQPMISRDGRTIGKLLLCMKESGDKFGPKVAQQVKQLEEAYGNIKVVASSSGKMTKELMKEWARDVLKPAVDEHSNDDQGPSSRAYDPHFSHGDGNEQTGLSNSDRLCHTDYMRRSARLCGFNETRAREIQMHEDIIPAPTRRSARLRLANESPCWSNLQREAENTCHAPTPKIALLADAWSGQKSPDLIAELRGNGVVIVDIPELTTAELQPLDVGFNRQIKSFVNRITHRAFYDDLVNLVMSRSGIINIQSLIWNQFSSPVYRDMITHAWHNTDPNFTADEMVNNPPLRVKDISFGFSRGKSCEVANCTEHAFVQCSHCGKLLCLHHFLSRLCFHTDLDEADYPASVDGGQQDQPSDASTYDVDMPPTYDDDGDDGDDLDLDLLPLMEQQLARKRTVPTTENPDTRDELK